MAAGKEARQGLDFAISSSSLMKYALPTLLSNIFMNIYGMVDSFFVSNLIGTDALSALNIVMPILMIVMAVGVMVSSGGSALCARLLGEGKSQLSQQTFTFLVLFAEVVSLVMCIVGFLFREPLLHMLGADDTLYAMCEEYAVVLFFILPACMAGMIYQNFFVTAGKPNLGFGIAVAGGVLNMVLDYLLIGVFSLGMTGAALATGTGYLIQSVAGTIYFLCDREGLMCFRRPRWDTGALMKSLSNGMSEMVSLLTSSVTTIAMNVILMRLTGADGVAAVTIVLTVQMFLSALFMGYQFGIAPVISYHYGKGDIGNLQKIYRAMCRTIAVFSVSAFVLAIVCARPLAMIFANSSETVLSMAVKGTCIFAPAFLAMGCNIMASSMFTALNDGKTSAIISLFRTFVFLMLPLLILPQLIGELGVWLSLPLAEVLTIVLSMRYLKTKRAVFHYA